MTDRSTGAADAATGLDLRTGLPEEWLYLLRTYPREGWPAHRNYGPLTQFWLARHDAFRQLGRTLQDALAQFREGHVDADRFGGFFAPRLQRFLTELHHHHLIEDHHYFPVFMQAERRLVAGFELLEGDHELIHHRIEAVIERANGLLTAMQERDGDRIRRAADAYAETSGRLISGLMRHLDDEEDLVVPLILDRSEGALGIG